MDEPQRAHLHGLGLGPQDGGRGERRCGKARSGEQTTTIDH